MNIPLRPRLLGLVLAALVPLVIFSLAGVVQLARQQRAEIERSTVTTARAVMSAVDAEMHLVIGALRVLTTPASVWTGDPGAFYETARRVIAVQPHWLKLTLFDPMGTRLFDTAFPYGPQAKPAADPESFEAVLQANEPVIGNVGKALDGSFVIPVRLPIADGQGQVKYVLTAVVKTEAILEIIQKQKVPPDDLIGVIDSMGVWLMLSRSHHELVGKTATSSLKALIGRGREGWGGAITVDDRKVYAAFSRSELTGWTALVAAPEEAVDGPVMRSYLVLGAGVVLSLLVGLLAATLLSGRITAPIFRMRDAAHALGRGDEAVVPGRMDIPELRDVMQALHEASVARRAAEAQRENALQHERAAREAAEHALHEKDQAVAMLSRSNLELERFAYVASHDLQTPLRAVLSFTQLLEQSLAGRLDPAERDWIARIIQGARRMHLLIHELLSYARIDSASLPFVELSLEETFEKAKEALHVQIEQAGAEVTRGDLPRVKGDPVQLSQLLQNLIGNAIKYHDAGTPRVHVEAVETGAEYVVSVRDNGIGIDPRHHERIFDIFQRLHTEQTYPGTGIGLALCRRVVHRHGGRIWVESEPGNGATFYFSFPKPSSEQP